jgi:hypothetical protein
MDRARPQGSSSDLIDSQAVTATASYKNLDIEGPSAGPRSRLKQAIRRLGKRNFVARDWPAIPAAKRAQMRQIPTADRMEHGQAIEIKTVIPDRETTSICQDWMVADAVGPNRSPQA